MDEAIIELLAGLAGTTIIGAVLVGIAWLFFKKFSESWLENKFAKDLEEAKKEHQKELQSVQMQIDARLDRAFKLHGKEFEVLSEAWRLMDLAYAAARSMSGFILQVPPLNSMQGNMLDLTLDGSGLSAVSQAQIRNAVDKEAAWAVAYESKVISDSEKARLEFINYFMANGIFMQPNLKDQFNALNELIIRAWAERHTNFQTRNQQGAGVPSIAAGQALKDEGNGMMKKLHDDISTRLWRSAVEIVP
jgi:hypothetical protein